jgi:hypothetical protein
MKPAAIALCLAFVTPAPSASQPARHPREMRFTGPAAVHALCTYLLDLRRSAEADGRLDLAAEVESDGTELTSRVWMGSAHAVGRIDFAGHSSINDSTLRSAMTIHEREPLDVRQPRRSLARINNLGVFEPLTLADITIARRDDGVTADLTIPLRARKRRWWSLSGPIFPGIGALQASVSSRLPPWGRGAFDLTTYFVSLNAAGFAKPFLFLTLQRPMLMHYWRTHAAYRIGNLLDVELSDPLTVPVSSAGPLEAEPLVCVAPKPRLWWLRRGATAAANIAFGVLIP